MAQRKVFIVHHSEDIEIILRYIIQPLNQEEIAGHKVKCVYDECFTAGKGVLENIEDAMKECTNVFVVLTEAAMERNWVKYETLLALEKSQRSGKLCVALILFNSKPEKVQDAWFGLLTDHVLINVDPNRDGWESELKNSMIDKLTNQKPMASIRIAANLSVGQVWSHFTGYARIVLPKLKEQIRATSWYTTGRFPEIEFNLVPQSAKTVRQLNELHDSIKYEGDLGMIRADRGSFRDRPYKISVYSIEDPDTKETYYFVAQIPNSLSILSKVEARGDVSDTPKEILSISKGERSLQVTRFYIAYNRLVNHPKNRDCNNLVRLLNYGDITGKDLAKILLAAVKEECEKMKNRHARETNTDELTQDLSESMRNWCCASTDFDRTVSIQCHQDCEKDIETAETLKKFLLQKNLIIWEKDEPGESEMKILEKKIIEAKWCVLIMSKEALHKEDSKYFHFLWRMYLYRSVCENEVRVIPILDGVKDTDVPADLCAVTYISKDTPNYMEKLWNIISCQSIKMEATVSAQDVHQGLAWAYVLNYLVVTLENHLDRLNEIQKRYPRGSVYKKLFIIVPSSCASKSLRSLDKDGEGKQIDSRFTQLEEIQFKTQAVGGVRNRDYQLIPYRIQAEDRDHIVAVEYPNAVLCLQEMAALAPLSGLQSESLHEEAWKFKELAQSIIDNTESVRNKAKLLYYDDSRLTVVDAMLEVLSMEPETSYLPY